MTAGTLDFSSTNNRISVPHLVVHRIAIGPRSDDYPTMTVGRENSYTSRSDVLLRLLELARKAPNMQGFALATVANWITALPKALPDPFVAIGDDGSISTEWDIDGNSLHITFADDGGEVYFLGADGDEWESSLDATGKLSSAMRVIAQASTAQR